LNEINAFHGTEFSFTGKRGQYPISGTNEKRVYMGEVHKKSGLPGWKTKVKRRALVGGPLIDLYCRHSERKWQKGRQDNRIRTLFEFDCQQFLARPLTVDG